MKKLAVKENIISELWVNAKKQKYTSILLFLICLFVFSLIANKAYVIADTGFMKAHEIEGAVIGKDDQITQNDTTTSAHEPITENLQIKLYTQNVNLDCPVNKANFDKISVGDKVLISVMKHRLSESATCINIKAYYQ